MRIAQEIEVHGRRFSAIAFASDTEANAFMAANEDYGLLDERDGIAFLAKLSDRGEMVLGPEFGRATKAKRVKRIISPVEKLARLQRKLERTESALLKLNGGDARLRDLSRHFHLGRVGGSGRNNAALNRRRERDLVRTIENAKRSIALTAERNYLRSEIARLQSA
jgi:hypothetical protein